ncbi:MAG: hypothetical protein F6K14_16870 [Symploca sp. SIO2C1]|nr:hypothetical protein [Symploca sp. SIO2C1]
MSEEITSEVTTPSKPQSPLEIAIEHYAAHLERLESPEAAGTESSIYEVLLARDSVENLLLKRCERAETSLAELVELDQRLKAKEDLIGATPKLNNWREVLKPPETAWWWYFSPTPVIDVWDQLDWLWNTLTVACLGMVGSLMINITNAMSAGGAVQWPETFMTLMQGTGLALVAGGTLTSKGQTQVEKLLERLNIPPKFRAEATFVMAITLLLISTGIYNVLPKYLFYLGTQAYGDRNLQQALIRLSQANQIQPGNSEISIALGKVYESLNKTAEATAEYVKVIPQGLPEAFNSTGRVLIKKNPERAEAILRLGIQRAYIRFKSGKVGEEESVDRRYQFRTNLGWALLQQERYKEAREELLLAVEFNKQFPDRQLGSGMAQCFLIKANLALGNTTEAIENWSACYRQSRPEFISEYQWLIDNEYYQLTTCLDTKSLLLGLEDVNVSEVEDCLEPPEFFPEPEGAGEAGEAEEVESDSSVGAS